MTNPLIDFPMTQYYFDTFIIGAHHSIPHMVLDLKRRRELAVYEKAQSIPEFKRKEYDKLISMIDNKLSSIDLNVVEDLELTESIYWINELARKSSIEVNSYGRIRPDTLELLLCLPEEDFEMTMRIVSSITNRIRMLSDAAERSTTLVPPQMPRTE